MPSPNSNMFTNLMVSIGVFKKKSKIICVGLDGSGKSTMVRQLTTKHLESSEDTNLPTIGFDTKVLFRGNTKVTIFDMSGQGRYREMWHYFFNDVHAVVFVLDTSDKERICVARDELKRIVASRDIIHRKLPFLFLANKCDLHGAIPPTECSHLLGLDNLGEIKWKMFACNSLTGQGLEPAFDWLLAQII